MKKTWERSKKKKFPSQVISLFILSVVDVEKLNAREKLEE